MRRTVHIRSSVFIWYSNQQALLYDTESYSSLLLSISENTRYLFDALTNPATLYSFSFDDNNSPEISTMVEIIKSRGFGVEENDNRIFVSLPPILGINNNWEMLKREGKNEAVVELLRTITFVTGKCSLCDSDNTTHYFDHELQRNELLDLNELQLFLNHNNLRYIKHLYFIIDGACPNDYVLGLQQTICRNHLESIAKVFFVVESIGLIEECPLLQSTIDIIVVFTAMPYRIIKGFKEYCFIVHSNEELSAAEKSVKDFNLTKYTIRPRYNGKNKPFLEDVFFSRVEDIINDRIPKRLIHIHQTLNINYFGHLLVAPDNKVYSNPFRPPIGKLSDGVYSLVYNEMEKNYLWRKTRRSVEPCSNCIYRDLCPSPVLVEELMERICKDYLV